MAATQSAAGVIPFGTSRTLATADTAIPHRGAGLFQLGRVGVCGSAPIGIQSWRRGRSLSGDHVGNTTGGTRSDMAVD